MVQGDDVVVHCQESSQCCLPASGLSKEKPTFSEEV